MENKLRTMRMVKVPVSDVQECLGWLEGALKCKKWEWSPDQFGYAVDAFNRLAPYVNLSLIFKEDNDVQPKP